MNVPTEAELKGFQATIYNYYHQNRRSFPWRETTNPYYILVSEIMLQQTQTGRVVEKYLGFLEAFPTVQDLAQASGVELLSKWQGLGYNRRALNLQKAAQKIVAEHGGEVPSRVDELDDLPGIGVATASAIAAFAFQRPVSFIETNIRRVYIHFFFPEAETVHDKELMPVIEQTVDLKSPRDWYYALMDYGAMLPRQVANPNRKSKHYTRQSTFAGSNRQARGQIIAYLLKNKQVSKEQLGQDLSLGPEKTATLLLQLTKEGFIKEEREVYQLI